jgi:hypothetical protein
LARFVGASVYEVTTQRARHLQATEPKRADALAQIAENCPRTGSRSECSILKDLNAAAQLGSKD